MTQRTLLLLLGLLLAAPAAAQTDSRALKLAKQKRDAARTAYDDAGLKRDLLAAKLAGAKKTLATITKQVAQLESRNLSWWESRSLYKARETQKLRANEVVRIKTRLEAQLATIEVLRLPLLRALWESYHALFEASQLRGPRQAAHVKEAAADLDLIGRLEKLHELQRGAAWEEAELAPLDPRASVQELRTQQLFYDRLVTNAEERLFVLRPYARQHGLVVERLSKVEARLPTARTREMLVRERARLAHLTDLIARAQRAVAAYQGEIDRIQLRIDRRVQRAGD